MIGATASYYIFHDTDAQKCSVVREKPTTDTVGAGEIFQSKTTTKAAMEKMAECAGNN